MRVLEVREPSTATAVRVQAPRSSSAGLKSAVFPASMKPMRAVASLLEEMVSVGVITSYAVFGAVAQMRYTEAVLTEDADVLIAVPRDAGLSPLHHVYEFCRSKGAEAADFEGVPLRVVRAEYLALIALETGRAKDFLRILSMVESGAISLDDLKPLAERHGLSAKLERFRTRFAE